MSSSRNEEDLPESTINFLAHLELLPPFTFSLAPFPSLCSSNLDSDGDGCSGGGSGGGGRRGGGGPTDVLGDLSVWNVYYITRNLRQNSLHDSEGL